MRKEDTTTRTGRYKEYRDDIKRNEEYVKYAPKVEEGVKKHVDNGEKKVVEKRETFKPYKIYRAKKIRRGIFYSIFVLILIGAVCFGILMFARYLGFNLW